MRTKILRQIANDFSDVKIYDLGPQIKLGKCQ